MLAPRFDAATANQTLPIADTPPKMLPPHKPPPVVQMRHSTDHNVQDCPTRRQLSADRWWKTTSGKELGRQVEHEEMDEGTTAITTNLLNFVVQSDGVVVVSAMAELIGQQVVSYQI